MSGPRRTGGFTPVHLLVLVAVAELSITRLAVNGLRPKAGDPIPTWYVVLDNVGLFLLYFGTTLAAGVLALRAAEAVKQRRDATMTIVAAGRLVMAALIAACAGLGLAHAALGPSSDLSFAFQTVWAATILVTVLWGWSDRWILAGLVFLSLPLLIHYGATFAANVLYTEDELIDGSLIERARGLGLHGLVIAALLSAYCFSPRPMARALTRIGPLAVALLIGGLGAVLVRRDYETALEVARYVIGVDLGPGVPSDDMALYLLALATLSWTLAACTIAASEARREVGMGLALVVLGGYGFDWPFHFLLGVIGILVIADRAPRLRDEEAPRAVRPRTPPIDDDAWQLWVGELVGALRAGDEDVKALTVRGDDDTTTSVVVGERHGAPFKLRLGRIGGALVSIDLVCGREIPETTRATVTLYARPDGREAHPPPPPAAPAIAVDDAGLAARFRVRGDAVAFAALLDDGLRARVAAGLDGWLAYWAGAGVRLRVYPGIGAPLDHPVPIADLATRGAGGIDRMVAVVDVVTAIAARGLQPGVHGQPEPALLD